MSARSRRDFGGLGLSFLDCVCCAFGAIILLLVISKSSELVVLEAARAARATYIGGLRLELAAVTAEARSVDAELATARQKLAASQLRMTEVDFRLQEVRAQVASRSLDAAAQARIETRLAFAQQTLTAEMKRLLGADHRRTPTDATIGGIPVDSEYVIFVIDTSGSMQERAWGQVLEKLSETLRIYPRVKGIQVLNDMGEYMFSGYRRRWIPDTPARRHAIVKRLAGWRPFSNSSPVEGIETAIRHFAAADKRISIYVFGDEFSGGAIEPVVQAVERLNRVGATGERRVRIHAVGFPTQLGLPRSQQVTGVRFAALMRVLAERNGGTFVGLNDATR